jgi:hypothetical protein
MSEVEILALFANKDLSADLMIIEKLPEMTANIGLVVDLYRNFKVENDPVGKRIMLCCIEPDWSPCREALRPIIIRYTIDIKIKKKRVRTHRELRESFSQQFEQATR